MRRSGKQYIINGGDGGGRQPPAAEQGGGGVGPKIQLSRGIISMIRTALIVS